MKRLLPVLALLLAASPAVATTIVLGTDEELFDQAELVAEATILSAAPSADRPATEYRVRIERAIKGLPPGGELVVRVPGGAGEKGEHSYHAPFYLHLSDEARLAIYDKRNNRVFDAETKATIGALGNEHHKEENLGKAGRSRHLGRRPKVRGVAQDPRSHPHGGGEGRSGIGMKSPKSPWGKRTLGRKTRKLHKYSDKHIIKSNIR